MTSQPIPANNIEPIDDVSPESASTNFFWRFSVPVPEGQPAQEFDLQTTLRGLLSPAQLAAHLAMIQTALVLVVDQGGVCKQVGNYQSSGGASTKSIPVHQPPAQIPSAPEATPAAAPQSTQDVDLGGADGYFVAETLEATVLNDKPYYKVKGGQFKKYDITVWPEVLAAAGKPTNLTPGVYDLAGYLAFYVNNDKGSPHKVTRLKKAE